MPGNPISFQELFDFTNNKDVRRAIKDIENLSQAYEQFKTTVTGGMFEKLAQQQSDLAQTVRDLVAANKDLVISNKANQKSIVEATAGITKLEEENRKLIATKKAVIDTENIASDSVDGLKKRLKELVTEYNKLSQSEAGFAAQQQILSDEVNETRKEINALTSVIKVNTTTFNAARNSYDALDAETKQLIRDLKALEGGMNSTSREARQMKQQIFENTQKLKAFDKEMNQNFRNVGNYGSALGGLTGQLKSYVLGLVAISSITRGIGIAFEKNVKFDAIARSLGFVSDNTIEAEKNMLFLRRTAEELGLDFEVLAKSFTRFAAATRGTNLEGELTRRIFTAVSKAAAVMKLSAEESEGVFLALEQIISKGKLQAEELRKQLGNSLPGAFQLFAKGLNISTRELDAFLKQGNITKDALVPFAEQLEKTFGPGVQENVNSVQSAMNRLGNTISQLFQGKSLSDFFGGLLTGTNLLIRNIFQLDKASFDLAVSQKREALSAQSLVNEYEQLIDRTNKTEEEKARLNNIVTLLTAQFGNSVVEIDKETGALKLNIQATKDLITQKLLLANDEAAKAAAKYKQSLDAQEQALKDNDIAFQQYNDAVKLAGKTYADLLKDTRTRKGTGFFGVGDPLQLLSEEEKAVIRLAESVNKTNGDFFRAEKQVAEYTQQLKELGFSIEDVNRLLNPEGADTSGINPFGGDEKTPEELERERQRQIKAAQDLIKATERLRIAQLESEYIKEEDTVENKLLFEDKKLQIITESVKAQQKLFKQNTDDYIQLEARLVDATNDRAKSIDKINEDSSKNFLKNAQKSYEDAQKVAKAYFDYQKSLAEAQAEGEIFNVLLNRARDPFGGNLADANADLQIFEIRKKFLQDEVQAYKNAIEDKSNADEEYYQLKKQLAEAEKQLAAEKASFEIAQAQRVADAQRATSQAAYDFVISASNAYFDIQSSNITQQMQQLEQRYNYERELAGSNKQALTTLDKNYQRERSALLKKQSEQSKNAAIFSATINALAGIVRAFADYPFPYSAIVAGLAGAAAFVEVAKIEKVNVPAYYKGRKNGPKEFARVNEKGPEFIERNGELFVAGGGKDTITQLEAGDKVYTHEESVKIAASEYEDVMNSTKWFDSLISGLNVHRSAGEFNSDKIVKAIVGNSLNEKRLASHFAKAVASLPLESVIFDERGYNKYTSKKNARITEAKNRSKIGGNG